MVVVMFFLVGIMRCQGSFRVPRLIIICRSEPAPLATIVLLLLRIDLRSSYSTPELEPSGRQTTEIQFVIGGSDVLS